MGLELVLGLFKFGDRVGFVLRCDLVFEKNYFEYSCFFIGISDLNLVSEICMVFDIV